MKLRIESTTKRKSPFIGLALWSIILASSLNSVPPTEAKATRQYQREVFVHLDQGSMLLESGQYQGARQEFQKAIELDPKCPDAFNNLGLTFYRTGDLESASSNYMKALEIEPLFVPSLSNLAAVRYQQGKFSDAGNLYRLALRLANDKDPQLHYNLANVLRDDKDYSEAEVHYQEAIRLKPDFAAAHNGLGATYYCLSDFDRAEQEVKKAISLKHDYALAFYHLGLIYTAKNQPNQALSAYESSLKFEKNKSYEADTRGKIAELKKMQQGEGSSAGARTNTAVSSGSADENEAASLIETSQFARAEKVLNVLSRGPSAKDPSFWNSLGYAQLRQNTRDKAESAIANLKKAVELSNGSLIEAKYNLACAYVKTGKWMSARQTCKEAIEEARRQEKLCPLIHNLHGIIMKHGGDLKGAESAYRIAIAQALGKLPVAHYNRALVLEKLHKSRDAVQEYQNYLRDAPRGANAEKARRRLSMLTGK
ncbi:MAG TPA: tetratricopeptide repeat protein [Candidatus Melainabacteria bacterium]|nr:tetratricopeptide repeat protein [Candidatus Melainabacteria bacterium]